MNNGGTFISQARYIAAWDGGAWSAVGSTQGPFDSQIEAIAVSGTDVYVGGTFFDLADNGTPIPQADMIARWDGAHWHALGDNGSGDGVLNSDVYSIAVSGSDVYAGGYFNHFYDDGNYIPEAGFIARFDGAHWNALGSNGAGDSALDNAVQSIQVDGSYVYSGRLLYER